MLNCLERGICASLARMPKNAASAAGSITAVPLSGADVCDVSAPGAMKLSAVDRCIEVLSDSIGKLPIYVMDRKTRKRIDHPITDLLCVRPNEAQTPSVAKKMIEANRLCGGNGYALIIRSPKTMQPAQLLPVPCELVTPWLDSRSGSLWYTVIHPFTGEPMTVHRQDMLHLMAYTYNGWQGVSVLRRASEVIASARAAQQYNLSYYANGGQPAGILRTEADLSGTQTVKKADGTSVEVSRKDILRAEWERIHAGPSNANRIAILDYGLDYKPISISNRDAQFVEQTELSVQDIARFFGVPLYKLQAGKQSYSSNEQNAIEYVVSTLHPIVQQYEEELTWKLLPPSDTAKGLRIRVNMMAELRGDVTSRSTWYKAMREIGCYSVNDILALEDLPDVDGGDERYASLNYVPLAVWRALSILRNGGEKE